MKRARIISSLLLVFFLQALLLASVHHHPYADHQLLRQDDSQTTFSQESGSQHCPVCEFLTTVNLFASWQAPLLEVSFADTELTPCVQDICIRQAETHSTRAPPVAFI